MSSRLFSQSIRSHIYAIYGLVRIADEIVDTYRGPDQVEILNRLEDEIATSTKRGYSVNPIVQAYIITAKRFNFESEFTRAFFYSMRIDAEDTYAESRYQEYIYGSAEVVGLMCLKVFCDNEETYQELKDGARALGRAYQKVNFLRDIRSDYEELGRIYFPGLDYDTMTNRDLANIIKDIKNDFLVAKPSVNQLPDDARSAVVASYLYYQELLKKLESSDIETLRKARIRVSNSRKLALLLQAKLVGKV